MLAVTAIDRPYLPGLVALHNSMAVHSPNVRLAALVYGDDDLAAEVRARGVDVIHNPRIDAHLPTSWRVPTGNPAMYARLLVPSLFGRDTLWLDADQVVLSPLDPLFADYGEYPCAAVPSLQLSDHIGDCPAAIRHHAGVYAGLIVFNHRAWTAQRVTERCFEAMNTSTLDFWYVVQSVLGFVLCGQFAHLSDRWQRFGNRVPSEVRDAYVVHWHGYPKNPWTHDLPNGDLWRRYA